MPSSLDKISWPVRTERLKFRPATVADLDAMWDYRGHPDVVRWMSAPPQEHQEFVERMSDPSRLVGTLALLREDELIGDLYLNLEDPWAQTDVQQQAAGTQAEIGYCLHPRFGGQGYAREGARALIDLCFGELGLRRVVANCFAANDASWRLMEAIGMRRESHTVKDSLHRELGWQDGLSYAVLAEEWPRS